MSENLELLKKDLNNLIYNLRYRSNIEVDDGFLPACRAVNGVVRSYHMPTFVHREVEKFHYSHNDTMVVAFSGGKLSLACAFRYKDIGKNIVLFHVAQPGEDVSRIKHIAELMQVPLYIHEEFLPDTYFSGMIILHMALMYAIGNGYSPKIVFGYFDLATTESNDQTDWKNCEEFIGGYKSVAKRYIEDFNVLNPIPNYSVMWDEILKHRAYIPYVSYRDNIDSMIFENIRMDYRIDEADFSLYFKNIQKLLLLYKKKKKANQATLNEVWNAYFFYRIEESIFYKELMERCVSSI